MNHRQFRRAFTLAPIAALLSLAATAADAAPANSSGTARTRILRQIVVTKTSDLDFGILVPAATASTVVISTAGVRTCGAGVTCTGSFAPAAFTILGTSGVVATITGDNSVTLTNGTGGTMAAALTRSAATVTLAATASTVQVGGTLSMAANQAEGTYSGTFNIVVDYQ
jgi:Mat/Ecp fimbriae major subunit